MWEVRTQFSKQNAEMPSGQLEWNSVLVDTQAEADTALRTRTARRWTVRTVHTMFDPQGRVVRVKFN
jgi:hypothetical protein